RPHPSGAGDRLQFAVSAEARGMAGGAYAGGTWAATSAGLRSQPKTTAARTNPVPRCPASERRTGKRVMQCSPSCWTVAPAPAGTGSGRKRFDEAALLAPLADFSACTGPVLQRGRPVSVVLIVCKHPVIGVPEELPKIWKGRT